MMYPSSSTPSHNLPWSSSSNSNGGAPTYIIVAQIPPPGPCPLPQYLDDSDRGSRSKRSPTATNHYYSDPYLHPPALHLDEQHRRYRYNYPGYYHDRPPPPPPPLDPWRPTSEYNSHWTTYEVMASSGTAPCNNMPPPPPSSMSSKPLSESHSKNSCDFLPSRHDTSPINQHYSRPQDHEARVSSDVPVVQPSFDDFEATHSPQQSPSPVKVTNGTTGDHQSQKPLGQDGMKPKAPDDVEEQRLDISGIEQKHKRTFSAHLFDSTPLDAQHAGSKLTDNGSNEDGGDDDVSSLGFKHRRLFSDDSMNLIHRRLDSIGTVSSIGQTFSQQHQRVHSAGLDILSAVADASKVELAEAAGHPLDLQKIQKKELELDHQQPLRNPRLDAPSESGEPHNHYFQQERHMQYHPLRPYQDSYQYALPQHQASYYSTRHSGHNDNPHMNPPLRRVGLGSNGHAPLMLASGRDPSFSRHPYGPPIVYASHINPSSPSSHYDHLHFRKPGQFPSSMYFAPHHQQPNPPMHHPHHHPPLAPSPHHSYFPVPHPPCHDPTKQPHVLPPPTNQIHPSYPITKDEVNTVTMHTTSNQRPETPVSNSKGCDNGLEQNTKSKSTSTEKNMSTHQGSQTLVTTIAVGTSDKLLTTTAHLKNASTNTDEIVPDVNAPSSIPTRIQTHHHRKMSSFSSVGLGTIFGRSILSPGVLDSPPVKSIHQHPLKSNITPARFDQHHHHRSTSSVSLFNVLDSDICLPTESSLDRYSSKTPSESKHEDDPRFRMSFIDTEVRCDNDVFLRNLQESVPYCLSPGKSTSKERRVSSPIVNVTDKRDSESQSSDSDDDIEGDRKTNNGFQMAEGGTSKRLRRKCSFTNCENRVVQGGLCIMHGAKRKMCSHPGCTKHVKKAGLCSSHGPARKRCSAPGCEKVAVQGGRCIAHGARKKICSVPDCNKQAITSGMCKKHFEKQKDQSDVKGSDNKRDDQSCKFGGDGVLRDGPPQAKKPRSNNESTTILATHRPSHTRGLSIFHDISADTVSSILNETFHKV